MRIFIHHNGSKSITTHGKRTVKKEEHGKIMFVYSQGGSSMMARTAHNASLSVAYSICPHSSERKMSGLVMCCYCYMVLLIVLKERSQVKQEAQLLLGDRATRKHAKDS